MGTEVSLENAEAVASRMAMEPAFAVAVTSAVNGMVDSLSGRLVDWDWEPVTVSPSPLAEVYPEGFWGVMDRLKNLLFARVTTIRYSDSFALPERVSPEADYASYSVNVSSDRNRPYVRHRIESFSSALGGIPRLEPSDQAGVIPPEILIAAPASLPAVPQEDAFLQQVWTACYPLQLLDVERGVGHGRRTIRFSIAKDEEFRFLLTSSQHPTGYYPEYLNDPELSDPLSSSSSEWPQDSESSSESPGEQPLIDAVSRWVLSSTATFFSPLQPSPPSPVTPKPVPTPEPWDIPEHGDEPFRRPEATQFYLNGTALSPYDRVVDVTDLIVNGQNTLVVDYFGSYGWSDWFLTPAIGVSGHSGGEVLSYKCLCFRYAGLLDISTDKETRREVIDLTLESLQTDLTMGALSGALFQQPVGGRLSCRPMLPSQRQKVQMSAAVGSPSSPVQYQVHLSWYKVSGAPRLVASGTHASGQLLSISFVVPRDAPPGHLATVVLTYGNRQMSRVIRIADKNRFSSLGGSITVSDYCC